MTPEILSQEARTALDRGDLVSAAESLGRMVELTPRDHGAWNALAGVLVQTGQAERGMAAARRAVSLDRNNAEYHNTLGAALLESGAFEEAIQSFRRALKLRPFLGRAYFNLGKALHKLERFDEAIEVYRRGERMDPQNNDLRSNLALALWEHGEIDEAVKQYQRLAALLPGDSSVASDLGNAISSARGAEQACEHYRTALLRFPQDEKLHWAYARELLATQQWERGWFEYLWRPQRMPDRRPLAGSQFEPLNAAHVAGRTVLLEPAQGLGDILFFCRFIDELRALGAHVLLRCPEPLKPLIEGIGFDDGVAKPDLILGIDDLPAALRSQKIPPPLALKVDAERRGSWKRRLAEMGPPPYTALTWRAGTDTRELAQFGRAWEAPFKRIDIKTLGETLSSTPGTLIAVQRLPRAGEIPALSSAAGRVVHDCTDANLDLAEMVAFLGTVDEYVGVSNTNVHIAAGIGLAARVLVPHPPEWRWLSAGDASPWFPGMRIYRQRADRSWLAAMAQLADDLRSPA